MKFLTAIALLMIFTGVISGVMYFFDYNLRILRWMNDFPQSQQWLIRGGLVVVGVLVLIIFRKRINTIRK
jgi:hypothetical protein